jgi:hypothetical protein
MVAGKLHFAFGFDVKVRWYNLMAFGNSRGTLPGMGSYGHLTIGNRDSIDE